MRTMPTDPQKLIDIAKAFDIDGFTIKVLDYKNKWNVPYGDKPLMEYMDALRNAGLIVEAWGYHYPEGPSSQGAAIEERRQKLGFDAYSVDMEAPWKQPYGMGAASKALHDPLKRDGFEVLMCSYRYPSYHPELPWNQTMKHQNNDGANPQVYWALRHDPVAQLERTFDEYEQWGKPIFPVGALFGASFKVGEETVWWEPTQQDIEKFRIWCETKNLSKIYYWSMDWVLAKEKWDWLKAATGVDVDKPPDPPEPQPLELKVANCTWLNFRATAGVEAYDNRVAVNRAGMKVTDLQQDQGPWKLVKVEYEAYAHGDYLEEA